MELEKTKGKLKKFCEYENSIVLTEDILYEYQEAIETLLQELKNQDKKIYEAYAKANNYLYFNDSADYEVALWEVIRSLKPDLAKKWDNGEVAELKYIKIKEN